MNFHQKYHVLGFENIKLKMKGSQSSIFLYLGDLALSGPKLNQYLAWLFTQSLESMESFISVLHGPTSNDLKLGLFSTEFGV